MIVITSGRDIAWADATYRRKASPYQITVPLVAQRASTVYERLRKRAYRRSRSDIYFTIAERNAYREGVKDALSELVNSL